MFPKMVDIDDQSGVEGKGLEAVQETVCLVELNLGSLGPIIIWTITETLGREGCCS